MIILTGPSSVPNGCGEHFRRKHEAVMSARFASGDAVQVIARHAGIQPHRVLFIEDTVPLRRIGSGFVRANDLIKVISNGGWSVTVFPVNGCGHDVTQVFHDMPDTVEVMHDLALDRLPEFMRSRRLYYDTVWIARTHNLAKVRPILTQLIAEGSLNARIVLDTEAVTPQREAARAALVGQAYDLDAAMRAILADAAFCQHTVAVTAADRDTLVRHGFPSASTIGHMIDPKPTSQPFATRTGMLFVGAIHTEDSPNLDGLIWFVDSVLPLIEAQLKWETRLTIAGYRAPGVDLTRFAHHPRITLHGPVADLTPLYEANRVFVAPTRYAAGAPYKVLEAASRGMPVVATTLLGEELGWVAQQEMLVAGVNDAAGFAAAVVRLYRDEGLWLSLRDAALDRLARENGREAFTKAVMTVLDAKDDI